MLDQALNTLTSFDWGSDPNLVTAIDQAVVDTQNDAAARASLESKLVAALESGLSRDATDYVCRKLQVVGTAASVPALAKLLTDEKSSHMARFSLQHIPGDEATAALQATLPKLAGSLAAGVIGTLGVRGDKSSVEVIDERLADDDAEVSKAAAVALGHIAGSKATESLLACRSFPEVQEALLRCAESFLANGKPDEALAIYKANSFQNPQVAKHYRLAAQRGELMCAAAKA